jgi:hypothetical protein
MAKKPRLQVVAPQHDFGAPPADLGEAGKHLWRTVLAEADIDAGMALHMLYEACVMEDRAGELASAGNTKEELAARAFVVRTLARLMPKPTAVFMGRPPGPPARYRGGS